MSSSMSEYFYQIIKIRYDYEDAYVKSLRYVLQYIIGSYINKIVSKKVLILHFRDKMFLIKDFTRLKHENEICRRKKRNVNPSAKGFLFTRE